MVSPIEFYFFNTVKASGTVAWGLILYQAAITFPLSSIPLPSL